MLKSFTAYVQRDEFNNLIFILINGNEFELSNGYYFSVNYFELTLAYQLNMTQQNCKFKMFNNQNQTDINTSNPPSIFSAFRISFPETQSFALKSLLQSAQSELSGLRGTCNLSGVTLAESGVNVFCLRRYSDSDFLDLKILDILFGFREKENERKESKNPETCALRSALNFKAWKNFFFFPCIFLASKRKVKFLHIRLKHQQLLCELWRFWWSKVRMEISRQNH